MAIYLDAEVIYGLSPTSLSLSSLAVIARAHGLEIAIPEIALNKATVKRQQQIEAKTAAIRSAIEKARGFFDVPAFREPDAGQLAGSWRTELLRGMRLIPVSGDHAIEALNREIKRAAPAREGGGAPDSAIWLAIRDDHQSKSEAGYRRGPPGLLEGEVERRFAGSWDVISATPGARIGRLNFSGTACASDKPGP